MWENWTIKKAECWRIEAFSLSKRRFLRVPWTTKRSIQSILKETNPDCSSEGLVLKLKLHYFGHLCEELTHLKRSWCWERLKAGGEGANRGWDSWMASPTQWAWIWASFGSWWWTGKPGMLQSMGLQSWTRLRNWIGLNIPASPKWSDYLTWPRRLPQDLAGMTLFVTVNY